MTDWIIDSDHSSARFSVRHFMIANVVGLFSRMTGVIRFDPPDMAHLSVEAEIEVGSLTTGLPARDEHLLSPDYFDAGNHLKIFFKSTRAESTGVNRGKVIGALTIRGFTHPVTLEVESYGPVKSPYSGKTCLGFIGTTRINREEYGMTLSDPMEGGGFVVSKDIEIAFDIEADLAAH